MHQFLFFEGIRQDEEHEDTLDAVFSVYLAWHCWRWGEERNEIFGTLDDTFIVVPKAAERVER